MISESNLSDFVIFVMDFYVLLIIFLSYLILCVVTFCAFLRERKREQQDSDGCSCISQKWSKRWSWLFSALSFLIFISLGIRLLFFIEQPLNSQFIFGQSEKSSLIFSSLSYCLNLISPEIISQFQGIIISFLFTLIFLFSSSELNIVHEKQYSHAFAILHAILMTFFILNLMCYGCTSALKKIQTNDKLKVFLCGYFCVFIFFFFG